MGLWIHNLDKGESARILCGQITFGSWAADQRKLVFRLGPPYFEIWSADLDPNVPTIEAFGPARTLDEHYQEMVALYTRRIETNPKDAYNYLHRSGQYQYLREKEKVLADMRRYHAILSQESSSAFRFGKPQNIRRIIKGPFGYQAVLTVESQKNGIQVPRIALGQKERCNMKSFQMPMLSMSLLGLCLLSGLDTSPVFADFTFGEPVNLGPAINSTGLDAAPSISADGLELYFHHLTDYVIKLWVSCRDTPDSEWGPAFKLDQTVNSSGAGTPCISADGLSLYLGSDRPGGYGSIDLWVTTRTTVDDNWGTPVNLGATVNSADEDWGASISRDGLELYFTSNRPGGHGTFDIWVSTRATTSDPWGTPVNLGPTLNTFDQEGWVGISPDGLLLFFQSDRPGGFGMTDLYVVRRITREDPWGPPMNLGPGINSTTWEAGATISSDGSMLYFQCSHPGGFGASDIWQVPIIPIVDFNGDGIVDAADVCIMIEHWLTDYPLCDIGPMPWGDGIVDVQDLIVLAEHLFEEKD
jgi:Tol biopolymer transport system component